MKASQIRSELLAEHAALRALIEQARDGSKSTLVRLGDALRRHNLHEEELLRGVLPTVDAWGPVRAEIMLDEHVKEHAELYEVLLAATRGTRALADLAEHLLEHMANEERTFLSEEVLDDDAVVADAFGG